MPLELLDHAWSVQGIRGQPAKSIDVQANGTALGVDLVDGTHLASHLDGLVSLMLGATDLFMHKQAAPVEVNSMLGKIQWYDLLNRFLLSALHGAYDFVRHDEDATIVSVPEGVLGDLALNTALFPYWTVDLTRGWMNTLLVTDASDSYGFGVCVAEVPPPKLVREVASLPYSEEVHIRCTPEPGAPTERPRSSADVRLPFGLMHFRPVLSQRARFKAHAGGLEASAVAQGLRVLSRSVGLYGRRGAFLVDAKAVMGALRKGRSSAPTLRHPICRCAALCIACDWTFRFHYVPSESTAADWPSRGLFYHRERARQRRRMEQRHNGKVRKYSKLERHLRAMERSARKLRINWPKLFDRATSSSSSLSCFNAAEASDG